ncbi:sulfatase [bacterium]|nr:sulfatase [bacterium]
MTAPGEPNNQINKHGMDRRRFLHLTSVAAGGIAATTLGCASLATRSAPRRPPNIVFVFADQMRSHVLGCYGNQQVPTPHFDRIAWEGARFENAISTWPVCSPFRAMLLTGRYPVANGTTHNDTAMHDGMPTIAKVCKQNGYATAYIGKWHLEWTRDPFVPPKRRKGFDYWASQNCGHKYFDSFYCGDTPERIPLPGYEPSAQTELAIDYIRENRERPFCLFISWGPPHDPYRGPAADMERFPADEIRLRPNVTETEQVDRLLANDGPVTDSRLSKARAARRTIIDDDQSLKEDWIRGYYANTVALDECMGRLLDALDEADLHDDTILVFSSDHGDMLGSHRMGSKQMPHEESISIPFLVRYPRRIAAGIETDALLGPIDIMPTLLGLAGIPCPEELDGIDLTDAARGKRSDQRDALLIMKMTPGGTPWVCNGIKTWRGVRTKRYTYAHLLQTGAWLLFDNQADPYQIHNLIGDPRYARVQADLEHRMHQLLKEAQDPMDDNAIIDEINRRCPGTKNFIGR